MMGLFVLVAASAWADSSPISLPNAIRDGLRNNPNIEAAQANASASRRSLERAWLQLLPSFTASRTWGQTNTSTFPATPSPLAPGMSAFNYGYSIPIYDGGITIAMIQAAQAGKQLAEQTELATRNALALQIAQTYASLMAGYDEAKYFDIIKLKLEKLKSAFPDSTPDPKLAAVKKTIDATHLLVRTQINKVQGGIDDARETYQLLVGTRAPQSLEEMSGSQEIYNGLALPDQKTLDEKRLRETPTIKIAEAYFKTARAGSRLEFASDFVPKLMFSQTWTRFDNTLAATGEPFRTSSNSGMIGLSISFNFGGPSGYAAARERERASKAGLQSALNTLASSVRQAYLRDEHFQKDFLLQAENIKASLAGLEEALKDIDLGKISDPLATLGLINVATGLVLQLVATEVQWITSRAQLISNLGLLSELKDPPVPPAKVN